MDFITKNPTVMVSGILVHVKISFNINVQKRSEILFVFFVTTHDLLARRSCGERNIVENDLIHILKQDHNDDAMFDIVVRFSSISVQRR